MNRSQSLSSLSEAGVDPQWAHWIDFDEGSPRADSKPRLSKDASKHEGAQGQRTLVTNVRNCSGLPKENNDLNRVQSTRQHPRNTHIVKIRTGGTTKSGHGNRKGKSSELLPRTEALLMAIAGSSITNGTGTNGVEIQVTRTQSQDLQEKDPKKTKRLPKSKRTNSFGSLLNKLRRK